MKRRKILLVEPGYRNKYPPLGLMKLSSYHKSHGDFVRFVKGEDNTAKKEVWDRVYVTSLFSFEWKRTARTIDYAIKVAGSPKRVFVGGIAVSLMQDEFLIEPRWEGVRFIAGLLDGPPAQSLQLSRSNRDFGVTDIASEPIETRVPDYGILKDIDYEYPVNDAYFGYASRGCVRKCHFCGVPKLEGDQKDAPPLAKLVNGVVAAHGPKKDLLLMDNNITASPRYKEIIAEIRDLGFEQGAVLVRNGRRVKRRVDFNQGVDARILAKSPMYLREMSTICISPLRIAFDHIGMRKVYDTAVRMATDNGIASLSNYMLYNFKDAPADLYGRMNMNIELNKELGIRIYSYPMRYHPVTLKDRSHIGEKWNHYYLRSFQIMLHATHGVVSGSSSFFAYAFGADQEEFENLLGYPHGFIFYRDHYAKGPGRDIRLAYEALQKRMTAHQRKTLLNYLVTTVGSERERKIKYQKIVNNRSIDRMVREAITYHALGTKNKADTFSFNDAFVIPSPEELVTDAGLHDHVEDIQGLSESVSAKIMVQTSLQEITNANFSE